MEFSFDTEVKIKCSFLLTSDSYSRVSTGVIVTIAVHVVALRVVSFIDIINKVNRFIGLPLFS